MVLVSPNSGREPQLQAINIEAEAQPATNQAVQAPGSCENTIWWNSLADQPARPYGCLLAVATSAAHHQQGKAPQGE